MCESDHLQLCHMYIQIKLHNTFLHDVLKSITERPELSSLRMLFSEHLEEYMCPNEVNRGAMIICNEQRLAIILCIIIVNVKLQIHNHDKY